MRRRNFLLGAGAAAIGGAAPAWGAAKVPLIGMLWVNSAEAEARIGLVTQAHAALSDLGYVEGRTIRIEERFGDGTPQRLGALAAELAGLDADLILTGAEGALAAARATKTIPIVTAATADPVAEGLAATLAHPGGNVTGNAVFFPQIMSKRLEQLKQALPTLARVGVLTPQIDPFAQFIVEIMGGAAKPLGVNLVLVEAADAAGYERAFGAAATAGIGGFVILDHPRLFGDFPVIATQALQYRVPSVGAPPFARAGGLVGYGVFFPALFRSSAVFVDKILKGARPADIPIEQATKFETVANLKTAGALGLAIPPDLLAQATQVIE